jgi:uncharacterized membrane protein (DUF2068 family)
MEKRWAEWLTIVQTAILIPVEVHEVLRRHGPVEFVALLLSVGVIIYLIWRMRHDDAEEQGLKNLNRTQT